MRAKLFLRDVGIPRRVVNNLHNAHRRTFASYEDTLAYRLYGDKPVAFVLHPVFPEKRNKLISVQEAEEALGLARAAKWDIVLGPSEPRGGWNHDTLAMMERLQHLRRTYLEDEENPNRDPNNPWYRDTGQDSDDEYSLDDDYWNAPAVRDQWVQSCMVRLDFADPGYYFGTGKLKQLAVAMGRHGCDIVFVNAKLTGTQRRNLERVFNSSLRAYVGQGELETAEKRYMRRKRAARGEKLDSDDEGDNGGETPRFIEVMDREGVVFQIFKTRAQTPGAKLQVALAEMQFARTRIGQHNTGRIKHIWDTLSQYVTPYRETTHARDDIMVQIISEGKATIEQQQRMVDLGLKKLRKQVETLKKSRTAHRSARKANASTIALVGYTNAGKTALMNHLTGCKLKERNLLFQTLDTAARRIFLPSRRDAVLVDSVGFIRDLPHILFDSFRATLEEITEADILIHVRDVTQPDFEEQKQVVISCLHKAGFSHARCQTDIVEVWNKIDLLDQDRVNEILTDLPPNVIPLSAKDGLGVDMLKLLLDKILEDRKAFADNEFVFELSEMQEVMNFLSRHGVVDMDTLSCANEEGSMMKIDCNLDPASLAKYEKRFGSKNNRRLMTSSA